VSVSFLQQVHETIRRHGMLRGGETVLVGVSGGPDSVCLFRSLLALAPSLQITLQLLHVHHGLRPEADAEADFVVELARAWKIPVVVERVHPTRSGGTSPEAAARRVRYAAIRQWAARLGASRVALGHTADDQAETVLMRLLQGAGPRGLGGIPPVREFLIRPLIELPRSAILLELGRLGQSWVEDPSNRDPKFLRNRIRHDLLPLLAGSYNPRIAEALCRVGALCRELLADLDEVAQRELGRLAVDDEAGLTLPLAPLRALPHGVSLRLLRHALARLGERAPLRGWAQQAIRELVERGGRRLTLGRVTLECGPAEIRLTLRVEGKLPARTLTIPGSVELPEARLRLTAREFLCPSGYTPATEPWRAVFDADSLPASLTIRGRRSGDRFRPFGAPGSKRLREFLIDAKAPRWRRDTLPLVMAGAEILWVVGIRRGAASPVTAATRRIVELSATPVHSPSSPLANSEEGSKMGNPPSRSAKESFP
jgi:tRNA(Ile)-lysidine synthase